MLLRLLVAALLLSNPDDVTTNARIFDAVIAVRDVAFDPAESPLFDGEDGRDNTALLLLGVAHRESRWNPGATSLDGDVGIMQTRSMWWDGHRREEILADGRLGYRVGLHALHAMRARCGGTAVEWLGAFVAGRCGDAAIDARKLCDPVGLCDL